MSTKNPMTKATGSKKKAEDPDTIKPPWNASVKVVDRINPHFDKDLTTSARESG